MGTSGELPCWEYRTVLLLYPWDAEFNELGAQGWELVVLLPPNTHYWPRAVFKRRRPDG